MKRLVLLSALILTFISHFSAMASNESETIPLSSDIIDKGNSNKPIKRTPPLRQYIELDGYEISWDDFIHIESIELLSIDGETMYYSLIAPNENSISIPMNIEGEYIIEVNISGIAYYGIVNFQVY